MGEKGVHQQTSKDIDIIILLAGEGRRLLPLTRDRPKGLISCEDGLSIFEHTIKALYHCGWKAKIVPVIGHGRAKMDEIVDSLKDTMMIQPVYNPFYASRGPLFSLYLGLNQSTSSTLLIMNGDTLIREALFERVEHWIKEKRKNQRPEIGVCVSPGTFFHADDMKVLLTEERSFLRVGKAMEPSPLMVKSAGVISVKDKQSREVLRERLLSMLERREALKQSYHWHNLLNELNGSFSIDLIEVKDESWYEIDTIFDLKVLDSKHLFFPKAKDQEDVICYKKGYL